MVKPGLAGAAAVHPGAVLGIEVFEQKLLALAFDGEVQARKGRIVDHDVRGGTTPDGNRSQAEFPAATNCWATSAAFLGLSQMPSEGM